MLDDWQFWDWQFGDWELWALTGAACTALVAVSYWADRRRVRRTVPDAVGWMPWTGIYFVSLLVACVSLGIAARAWFRG